MINRQDVDKLAQLARIEISKEEGDSLMGDLGSILGYVSELASAPTVRVAVDTDDHINIFRADEDAVEPGLYTDKILANAPRTEDGYLLVQQIIAEKGERQ